MKIAIKSNINDRFFSAEYGGGIDLGSIALTANREAVGSYETFEEEKLSNGCFALKTYSGNYLTADINGSLRTNSTEVGAWENFIWDGEFIQTFHGTRLTSRIDKSLIPIETTLNKGSWEIYSRVPLESSNKRTGIVKAYGRAAQDDSGLFHPLGLTFFWALYGWKFERDRIVQHLDWLNQYGFDYLRILGEVNWSGRSIEPSWPDYQTILSEFVDYAYDQYGLRSELTLVGGKYRSGQETLIPDVIKGREHKFIHLEVCNEWTRSDKMKTEDMVRVGDYLRKNSPNLVSLSRADDKLGYQNMIELTKKAKANMFTPHLRRSDHDVYWSHVRQGYDMKEFPFIDSNNEPQGPQSSVDELSNPMQLAMARATGIVCSGSFYVLHVGQGVTGEADPNHGRPQNMWEVPNIDSIMKSVRAVDVALPQDIENWKVVNNSRSEHPLPLDPAIGKGFWEGSSAGSVNKNYACINGNKFVEVLLGVNNPSASGSTMVGKAKQDSYIKAYNISDYSISEHHLKAGDDFYLTGRSDKMAGYILIGNQ